MGWGGAGVCCENMLFLTKVQGFNSLSTVLNTNVSLQRDTYYFTTIGFVLHRHYSDIYSNINR